MQSFIANANLKFAAAPAFTRDTLEQRSQLLLFRFT
jgi:hypothetical protein